MTMKFFLSRLQVYDEISNHFSETRHKQWPNVAKFIDNLVTGGLLLDVGCGNGKYLHDRSNIFKVIWIFFLYNFLFN